MGVQLPMDVEKVGDGSRDPRAGRACLRPVPGGWPPDPPTVVVGPPLGVVERLIGLVETSQTCLGVGIVRVQIWMIPCRHSVISLSNIVETGLSTDP
jgi:hypothetical protein